jgi:hypothetical protein
MRKGVVNTAAVLLFLSDGVLARPFVQFEIREAMARQKTILLVHETDSRHGAFDFRAGRDEAPADLQQLLDSHESLPFRRRGYERDGMLTTLIERAGFKGLFDGAQRTETQQEVLAAVPTEVRHFDLESFHDRPVQAQLMTLLLLVKGDDGFTSCVLIHGMGGTGKTLTAVAVVQETVVRQHFSKMYWLVVGQDATGTKIRQLQAMLYKQLTGKEVIGEAIQANNEQEWLGMLEAAMTMERSLVVLDDPWLPEQVRYLNPVDGSRTEHRLLVTTRIRGLMPKATCVNLSAMGKDEAVVLLLDVANIEKATYLASHAGAAWPPRAAYEIANECGLLPMTLSITAQVMKSWGDGWEEAVLPLLKQEDGNGRAPSTAEERIIGAGLKSLKGEDAGSIEELFRMFAVTQEDFVHSMAVIELLWRSCCGSAEESAGGLRTRLKVRQWTNLLLDRSLLLGSVSKGVHLHDIVLTHLRKTRPASELRSMHARVVEGLVAASGERAAATGEWLQDTGSTAQAFDGEEVDWYACNVGSFHAKQSMDASVALVEREEVKRWLLLEDKVMSRQVALAVGQDGMEELCGHYRERDELFAAAKTKWALVALLRQTTAGLACINEALVLLERSAMATTNEGQQLELVILQVLMRSAPAGSAERARAAARMGELMENTALHIDPYAVMTSQILPVTKILMGMSPDAYENGRTVTPETRLRGARMLVEKLYALTRKAADASVGARKEVLVAASASAAFWTYQSVQNTEEGVLLTQGVTDRVWGSDCKKLMSIVAGQTFDRHHLIWRSVGMRYCMFVAYSLPTNPAEKTGDTQQLVDTAGCIAKYMLAYSRASPPPSLDVFHSLCTFTTFTGIELPSHLQPLYQSVRRFYGAYGVQSPAAALEWYLSSAEFGYWHQAACSSSDGLHHRAHPDAYSNLCSAGFTLAAGDTSGFDMGWLDDLPPADSSTLRCTHIEASHPAPCVLLAEVLEQQGRHADACRFAQAYLQSPFSFNLPSKAKAGRVLGRCHAAMGEHTLSIVAFDAAIEMAKARGFLWSEALSVRGRALAGKDSGASGGGLHWDEYTGKQRVAEVMGRMQGSSREQLVWLEGVLLT